MTTARWRPWPVHASTREGAERAIQRDLKRYGGTVEIAEVQVVQDVDERTARTWRQLTGQ